MAFDLTATPQANSRKNAITVTVTSAVKTNLTYTYTIGSTVYGPTNSYSYTVTTSAPTGTDYSVKVASSAGCSTTKSGTLSWYNPAVPDGFSSSTWCGEIKLTGPHSADIGWSCESVTSGYCQYRSDDANYFDVRWYLDWDLCPSPWTRPGNDISLDDLSGCAAFLRTALHGARAKHDPTTYNWGVTGEFWLGTTFVSPPYFLMYDNTNTVRIKDDELYYLHMKEVRCVYSP
jgi:hypothetical protein